MRTLRGNELNAADRAHVLQMFIYRQTVENNERNPAAVKHAGGSLPLITDEQWLAITDFEVTKAGRLDKRADSCTTHHHEIPEHKQILDAWSKQGQAVADTKKPGKQAVDVEVSNQGSIVMIRPVSKAAKDWVDEKVQLEGWQWMGGAFACEPRMVENLVDGMTGDGLVVA